MSCRFEIMDANMRQYRRYNAVGRQPTAPFIPPSDNTNPVAHFQASVNDFIEHALRDVGDRDVVGITIQNDKPIGISFRRKDQLSAHVK